MTAGFPLSISCLPAARGAAPTPTAEAPLDDLQDGFVRLRRRDESRLWFRMTDHTTPVAVSSSASEQASTSPAKSTENPGTDKLVSELVRVVQAGRSSPIDAVDAPPARSRVATKPTVVPTSTHAMPAPPSPAALASTDGVAPSKPTDWRTVQAGAPVLLLSAGPILETSRPGPILGPGMRYRILSMTGSVVEMEVMHGNGDTRGGYANAVDLRCIEPKIHTGELQTEKGLTGRLRLTKLATTTFGLFGG